MRFTKPQWLSHAGEKKDHEVYSCHVSPNGARLATAAGDCHVRIWSTEAILNAANPSYTKPRQLASLSYHSGTVHAVRFSPNGKWLASGADDRIVCIYILDPSPPVHTTFGSNDSPPVENWKIFRRLNAHENDVQDLGWSHDSSILVTVGLDSKVVIWSGSSFEKLKTLSQHQSHVKGITFDPANKYFATASDDRTIRIYRFTSPPANATAHDQTSNFMLETTVTAPFTTSPLTTYFRRCSWSPEGMHIAAANAVNGPVSSVAIINRGSWDSEINLIGHEGPVEVCAFSPRLFGRTPPQSVENGMSNGGTPPVTVVACAGQDKTLSVWNTSFPRPFVTTSELCAKAITDLAWSPDGETLYLTSLDGTIAAMVFEKGELGYPAPIVDNDNMLMKYGAGRRAGIIGNPDALRLEEGSKAGELKDAQGRMGQLMGDSTNLVNGNANGHVDHVIDLTASSEKSVADSSGVKAVETEPVASAAAPPKDPQAERIDKLKQRVTITKDGKKRIAPLLVSTSNQGEANLPRPQLQNAVKQGVSATDDPVKILDLSRPYDGLPKLGMASLLMGNKRRFAEIEGDEERRVEKSLHAIQQTGATPILHNTVNGLMPASSARKEVEIADALRPAIINPALSVSQVRLAVPLVRTVILRPQEFGRQQADSATNNGSGDTAATAATEGNSAIVLEARNPSGPSRTGRANDREPTRLTVSRRSQVLWQDFLPKPVLLVTGNRKFWAAACEDGSLHTWTPAGRRILNAIVLESQAVILDCRGWWLMAITAIGQCYVWNMQTMSAAHPPVSLAPALDIATQTQQGHLMIAPSLMFARLNSQGRIVVGMSSGDGFSYNLQMYTWQRLSDAWWAVGSQYWNTTDTSVLPAVSQRAREQKTNGQDGEQSILDGINPENISAGIIPLLERNTTSQSLIKGRAFFLQKMVKQLLSAEGFEGFESSVSIAHLENRLAAAVMLGSRDEFRVYLIMYAKRLAAEGLRFKVEELLKTLMGSIYEEGDLADNQLGVAWGKGEEIVGWKRHELLKEVVMVLGKHRDLQRMTVPYARFLGVVGNDLAVNNGNTANDTTMTLDA